VVDVGIGVATPFLRVGKAPGAGDFDYDALGFVGLHLGLAVEF
jgi:hypothetical protein